MTRKSNEKLWNHLINELDDFTIQAGWFENSRYDSDTPIAYVAAIQNYGCTFEHPGGTPYYINATTGLPQFVSKDSVTGRYLSKNGILTKSHWITIPARPFMDNAKKRIEGQEGIQILLQELLKVFEGRQTMNQAVNRLGMWAQKIIQDEIRAMNSPALKRDTVRKREKQYSSKKKKTSVTPNKPLVDTGLMLAEVQYKAERKQ